MPTNRKGRNPQKKVGIRGDFHNPAFPGYASNTKQLKLEESFLDESEYKPLQGTPEEEIDLLRSLSPLLGPDIKTATSIL